MFKPWKVFLVFSVTAFGAVALVFSFQERPTETPAQVAGVKVVCEDKKLEDRIRCSLKYINDSTVLIMPEACRNLHSAELEECRAREEKLRPCFGQPVGARRAACASNILGIQKSIKVSWQECAKAPEEGLKRFCQQATRQAAARLAKFRLDDLTARASELVARKKIPSERAVVVIAAMERYKAQLDTAKNYAAQKKVLDNARATWKKFVTANKLKGMSNDYLAQAYTDLVTVK